MFRALIAISVAAIGTLFHQVKEFRSKLSRSKEEVAGLMEKVENLSATNEAMAKAKDETESHFFEQLRQLKSEFEEEWLLREKEWNDKMSSKEEDAQKRLEEISSWQTELARLRTEAIAIRSAIEKVRSRSTSPGRSELQEGSIIFSDSGISDTFSNKENPNGGIAGKAAGEVTSKFVPSDPLRSANATMGLRA